MARSRMIVTCCEKCGGVKMFLAEKIIAVNCSDCLIGEVKEAKIESAGDGSYIFTTET